MAGNTSIEIRNMGVSILESLLRNNKINKSQYRKITKKYFSEDIYMERHIALSSFSARGEGNNRPGDFTVKFSQPIVLESNY